jgi:hypothetical protein
VPQWGGYGLSGTMLTQQVNLLGPKLIIKSSSPAARSQAAVSRSSGDQVKRSMERRHLEYVHYRTPSHATDKTIMSAPCAPARECCLSKPLSHAVWKENDTHLEVDLGSILGCATARRSKSKQALWCHTDVFGFFASSSWSDKVLTMKPRYIPIAVDSRQLLQPSSGSPQAEFSGGIELPSRSG